MSNSNNESENFALGLVALIVSAVLVGVVWLGASQAPSKAKFDPATALEQPASYQNPWPQTVVFAPQQEQLSDSAQEVLSFVAHAARMDNGIHVQLVPFYKAGSEDSRALAMRRAAGVRHALEANGIAPKNMYVTRPMEVPAADHANNPDRIEISLQ
jgi:outer membrane protein OmpA-like peptidoglycan-associated protein